MLEDVLDARRNNPPLFCNPRSTYKTLLHPT